MWQAYSGAQTILDGPITAGKTLQACMDVKPNSEDVSCPTSQVAHCESEADAAAVALEDCDAHDVDTLPYSEGTDSSSMESTDSCCEEDNVVQHGCGRHASNHSACEGSAW